jgi:hypothetical protein
MPTYTRKEGDVTVTYTEAEYVAKKEVEAENAAIGYVIGFVVLAIAGGIFMFLK